jgi:cysteine sulfinate desulfinase/cysteine desulfurase-like protein
VVPLTPDSPLPTSTAGIATNFQYEAPLDPTIGKLINQFLTAPAPATLPINSQKPASGAGSANSALPNSAISNGTAFGGLGWISSGKWGAALARTQLDKGKELLAQLLGVSRSTLIATGASQMIFHWGISGLAKRYLERKEPLTIIHSPIDRQEVHAVADSLYFQGTALKKLPVDSDGYFDTAFLNQIDPNENCILVWQIANIEIGVIQEVNRDLKNFLTSPNHHLVIDATASGSLRPLDQYLGDLTYDVALFDSAAWSGPVGIGFLSINNQRFWQNPNPDITGKFNGGGVNPALELASALALEKWTSDFHQQYPRLVELQSYLTNQIAVNFPKCEIVVGRNPLITSLAFERLNGKKVNPEQLVNHLLSQGILVDSGSSCQATLCEPSYVLTAINRNPDGNIRINLHFEHHRADIDSLIKALLSF